MLERSLTPRSRCAAPDLPRCTLSQRALCLWAGTAESFLTLAACFLPWLSLGSRVDAVTRPGWLVPARMWGLAASWPSAPCSVPAFARVTDTWQRPKRRGLGRCCSALAIELQFLEYKSSCVVDVNRNKRLNGRTGSFTHLGKIFINYYLKARAFLKIHCILPSLEHFSDKWKAELDVDYTKI